MITIYKTNSMKNASDYILYCLRNVNKSDLSVTHTVIVPDRASLEAERALLNAVGGSFNVQVRTFRRLANEVLPQYTYLSKQAGIMALTGIITDKKSQLVCYTRGVETAGFISDMYDTISMMKYCKISPENLMREDLPKSVAAKVHDIALLYRAYCDYTNDRFIDSADKMDLLSQKLCDFDGVKNGFFYLYDFDNFSKQELSVVEGLMKNSLGVTVACCFSDKASDRHLYLNDIYNGVMNLCKNLPHQVIEQCSHQNKVTQQICQHLYRYDNVPAVEADGFVQLFSGATRTEEVYQLACKIQQYVRDGGRYRDIYAVTSDVNNYSNAVSTIFKQFEIPFFCDKQFCLADHPYSRYILDYLLLCKNNARLSFVLPFVKNFLFCGNFGGDTSQEDAEKGGAANKNAKSDIGKQDEGVFLFENYCLKYNVSYDFSKFDLGKNEVFFGAANAFREKFFDLHSAMQVPASASGRQYVETVRKLVQLSQLNEKNASLSVQQSACGLAFEAKVTGQVQAKFDEVLYQAEQIFGERQMKLEEFVKMLTVAVSAVNISVIPLSNDCVVFANMAKARKHDIKFLALLGANYGAMPIVKSDCKLLSDKNLQDLGSVGLDAEPQIFTENRRERFSLFQLLQEPSKMLYISCAETDGQNSLTPSQFVLEMSRLFCENGKPLKLSETKCEDVFTHAQALAKVVLNRRRLKDRYAVNMPSYTILEGYLGKDADKYDFTKTGDVSVSDGKQLFLANAETSVSKLTDFYNCPYRFYFEYGLGVKPRPIAQLKAADLGNILHEVLEVFVRDLDVNESAENTVKRAKKCFSSAISSDFYKGMTKDPQLAGTLEQLKIESLRMCTVVKEHLANSRFTNRATELKFGSHSGLPPVQVDYGKGKFLLVGKIDRLDVWGDKFVVIDYKSGSAAARYTEKDLYIGHKLQLLVYVKAVQTAFRGYTPAGFYYFNMHNNFSDVDEEGVYQYSGRTLDDLDTVCALDTTLQSRGKSERLGVKLKSDGELSRTGGKLLSEEQFQNQVKYALLMIARAGELMEQGYCAVSPYKHACEYCDYRQVCDFGDTIVREERNVSQRISRNTIDNTVEQCED